MSASALLAALARGLAQRPTATMPRIGFLGVETPAEWSPRLDAFRTGLRDLGYVEGANIAIDFRFAEGQFGRLPGLAEELVNLNVDVLVTHSTAGALAAKNATATNQLPVVMTNVGDAVGTGIVASLARPGGNITGDTFFAPELAAKRLEVLTEAMPRARRIAVVANPDSPGTAPQMQAMEVTAKVLDLALLRIDVRGPADFDGAFAELTEKTVDAVVVNEGDTKIIANVRSIAERAIPRRLPSIGFIENVDAGGLFGYGVDFLALYRRAAVFVDKILKGAKPANIPIERPTTFEFTINVRTAIVLGFPVTAAIRMHAAISRTWRKQHELEPDYARHGIVACRCTRHDCNRHVHRKWWIPTRGRNSSLYWTDHRIQSGSGPGQSSIGNSPAAKGASPPPTLACR